MSLPKDDETRKRIKPFAGFFAYFPDAIAAVAELSFIANEKHNPGEPMHWAKGKSTEQRESQARHMLDEAVAGPLSRDEYKANGQKWAILHAVMNAWRAMAQVQTLADQGHNIYGCEIKGDERISMGAAAESMREANARNSKPLEIDWSVLDRKQTDERAPWPGEGIPPSGKYLSDVSNEPLSPAEEQELDFIESLNRDGRGARRGVEECDCPGCNSRVERGLPRLLRWARRCL